MHGGYPHLLESCRLCYEFVLRTLTSRAYAISGYRALWIGALHEENPRLGPTDLDHSFDQEAHIPGRVPTIAALQPGDHQIEQTTRNWLKTNHRRPEAGRGVVNQVSETSDKER